MALRVSKLLPLLHAIKFWQKNRDVHASVSTFVPPLYYSAIGILRSIFVSIQHLEQGGHKNHNRDHDGVKMHHLNKNENNWFYFRHYMKLSCKKHFHLYNQNKHFVLDRKVQAKI